MSGHSKWSTIRRQKEATDQQRGKIFTKLARAITIAVKEGGGVTDPEMNFKLRLAIEKAKQSNMPKANIDRAIASGSGPGEGDGWQEITYEGYGPYGVATIVDVVTDNRNRALSEVKQIFDRSGGTLGQSGSVNYLFDKLGWISLNKTDNTSVEMVILKIMDINGVTDVNNQHSNIEVFTQPDMLNQVLQDIKQKQIPVTESSLILKPKLEKKLSEEQITKFNNFIEKLEDSEEVQNVWHNVDLN